MLQSPVFLVRKGTRSRPNVKIPKVFDSHYEERLKEATVATIVREPHTDQNDPLIGVDVEEIKAEPVDVEESAIEVEENMVNYIVQGELIMSCVSVFRLTICRQRISSESLFKKSGLFHLLSG